MVRSSDPCSMEFNWLLNKYCFSNGNISNIGGYVSSPAQQWMNHLQFEMYPVCKIDDAKANTLKSCTISILKIMLTFSSLTWNVIVHICVVWPHYFLLMLIEVVKIIKFCSSSLWLIPIRSHAYISNYMKQCFALYITWTWNPSH